MYNPQRIHTIWAAEEVEHLKGEKFTHALLAFAAVAGNATRVYMSRRTYLSNQSTHTDMPRPM